VEPAGYCLPSQLLKTPEKSKSITSNRIVKIRFYEFASTHRAKQDCLYYDNGTQLAVDDIRLSEYMSHRSDIMASLEKEQWLECL
jgi:hypothetical protein